MIYRRRPSPLHAARAVVGLAWCVSLSVAALVVRHPVALAGLVVAAVVGGWGARTLRPVLLGLLWSVPFGVAIALSNGIFSRNGLSVVWRLGGSYDVTLEALVQGGVYALSATAIIAVAGLYSAAVDPDDLLRSCRRLSFASALTAALATRLVPVLWRDGQRLADAQRARAGEGASRLALVRAVSTGAMDRALDVAATLEVRGYGGPAPRNGATRLAGPAWSRHDAAFALSAVGVIVVAVLARHGAAFSAYPLIEADWGLTPVLWGAALALVAVLPFADRRGIG